MAELRSIRSIEPLVTREELAELLNVSTDTIDAMRRAGMPWIPWGGSNRPVPAERSIGVARGAREGGIMGLVMAYADPPYIGQSEKHYRDHPDYAGEVDHTELVQRLEREYPDGIDHRAFHHDGGKCLGMHILWRGDESVWPQAAERNRRTA